jgi:hypothetical protein
MPIELNELETRRFGVVCAHVTNLDASLESIDAAARGMRVAMLVVRLSSRKLQTVHALETNGFRLMDTLAVYSCRLGESSVLGEVPEGVTTRLAVPSDADAVERIARDAFSNYHGHYHCDPRLDQGAATESYVDWARRSIVQPPPGVGALLACKDGAVVGFLTYRMNSDVEGELLLNGISPSYRKIGVNGLVIGRVKDIVFSSGRSSLMTMTQITNVAAQRVWVRQGFLPEHSYYTFHKWYTD